mmetsp:Transcript_27059/g.31197  ORF Transcript_27059/g.31197 Transcript_27059/m.31197 type:complete len:618 (-) Transcript_27059:1238-3091(-)|eukprot:CAMPEP_0114991598 /NCGR_PEP_ID=MMETSP0216-20121206/11464_1 /TAXON_ID=223996 /ORGANISM="Protocruzia adherens, Strain Boccale" /LENGTH=617 /DNA_ID=CAMNT_0002354949 /DNA_START=71 /DNA_END=1924 /DNA_ORIENTATION=-
MESQIDNRHDYYSFNAKSVTKKRLNKGDKIVFSDLVTKYNHRNRAQPRYLVVTKTMMYNIAKNFLLVVNHYHIRRGIKISQLTGVTRSKVSNEFVLHIANEYDYRMRCEHVKELIEVLKNLYLLNHDRAMPVYEAEEPCVVGYCTTKFDAKLKLSKWPSTISLAGSFSPSTRVETLTETDRDQTHQQEIHGQSFNTTVFVTGRKTSIQHSNTLDSDDTEKVKVEKNRVREDTDYERSNTQSKKGSTITNEEKQELLQQESTALKVEVKQQDSDEAKKSEIFSTIVKKVIDSRKSSSPLDHYELKAVIGQGCFGKILLAVKRDSREVFAIKSLRKDIIIERKQIDHIKLERKLLDSIDHPFLMKLEKCCQSSRNIYFVMKFISGGDLFTHLRNSFKFPTELTKFYTAQICLAIQRLHDMDILYRDLKLENILVDKDGYIKLTDFGMAKHMHRTGEEDVYYGTTEYIAPEGLEGQKFVKASDWWSVGVLIYEMLVGVPPFYHQNVNKMRELIKFATLRLPEKNNTSPEALDLISKLLVKDSSQRLSSLEEIKEQEFFRGFDWEGLLEKELEAPWKPTVEGELDTSNFDEEFVGRDPVDSVSCDSKMEEITKNQGEFLGF